MSEDLSDNFLVFYERYDPHLPRALRADKRIYRVNFPNKSGPILPRLFGRFVWVQDAGYPFILVFLSAFTTTNVTVITVNTSPSVPPYQGHENTRLRKASPRRAWPPVFTSRQAAGAIPGRQRSSLLCRLLIGRGLVTPPPRTSSALVKKTPG